MGCTFWISFWSLQCFFSRNVCRMREQLCQIDHSDSIAWMPSRGSLGYVLPRVIRLTLCLPSLPGLGRCSARQPVYSSTSPRAQPNWWWGSQGLVAAGGGVWRTVDSRDAMDLITVSGSTICSRDGCRTWSRYESRRYNQPSATQRLIVADSLGISFSLCRFLGPQSSALTGSCCRPRSQQDHHICWFVSWVEWNAGLVAGWSLLVPGWWGLLSAMHFRCIQSVEFPGLVGTFFLHLGEASERIWAICRKNLVRETQGTNRWQPSLGMKFPHGSLEVHQLGMKLWEPRICSMYSVSSHCGERCFFHGSFHLWSLWSYIYIHLHSRILLIVSLKPDSSIWNPWFWNLLNSLCEICLWPPPPCSFLAPVECTLGAPTGEGPCGTMLWDTIVAMTWISKVAFRHLGMVLLMSWVELGREALNKNIFSHNFFLISRNSGFFRHFSQKVGDTQRLYLQFYKAIYLRGGGWCFWLQIVIE